MRTRYPVVIATVLIAGAVPAAPLAAQADTVHVVQTPLRSPALAAIFEVHPLIPLLGHWYAGDVKRGLLPTVVNIGGLALFIPCVNLLGAGASNCSGTRDDIALVGALAFVSGWVWRMVSAHNTAKDQNRLITERQATISLFVEPLPQRRLGVGLALRF